MGKILTNLEFIEKVKVKFKDTIDTSLIEYQGCYEKVKIPTKHGICLMVAKSLLEGNKPTIQSAINKTEYWINQAKEKHGDLYDYSLVNYKGNKMKIKIICKEHGVFEQTPNCHLNGCGCHKCGRDTAAQKTWKNINNFVRESNIVHNNKYDYSLSENKGHTKKIKIVCPLHGIFEKSMNAHLKGQGCITCGKELAIEKNTHTLSDFLEKAKQIHGYTYDYTKSIYIHGKIKLIIGCNIHGDFSQKPHNHINGQGCPICAKDKRLAYITEYPHSWSDSSWIKRALLSKNFDSFKSYIIKCWNDEETFYKIGKTFTTIEKRFYGKNMPYNYEVIETFIGIPQYISKLEDILKKFNKENKYLPLKKFGGRYECFSEIKLT